MPDFMLKALLNVKIGVMKDAPIVKLKVYSTVLISPEFSIGVNAYSIIAKDLAKQGCIVLVMEH